MFIVYRIAIYAFLNLTKVISRHKPPFDFGILSKADIRLTIIFFFILRSVSVPQHLYGTFFHMPDTVQKAQSKAKTVYRLELEVQ